MGNNQTKSADSDVVETTEELVDRFIMMQVMFEADKSFIEEDAAQFARLSDLNLTLNINGRAFSDNVYHKTHELTSDCLIIFDRGTCLRIFSNFGRYIRKVVLDFTIMKETYVTIRTIVDKMIEGCAENLNELEFINCIHIPILKPFPNLHRMVFTGCVLDKFFMIIEKFDFLFPALLSLELKENLVEEGSHLGVKISSLRHLIIDVRGTKYHGYTQENFLALLKLNPQLTSLCLFAQITSTFLYTICAYLPELQHLKLHMYTYSFEQIQVARFKKVKTFTMELRTGKFRDMPIEFEQLTELHVLPHVGVRYDYMDFIQRQPLLTKLTIESKSLNELSLIMDDLRLMADKLPNIVSVMLIKCSIYPLAALALLQNSKTLKEFRFNLYKDNEYLTSNIAEKWNWTEEKNVFHCQRKEMSDVEGVETTDVEMVHEEIATNDVDVFKYIFQEDFVPMTDEETLQLIKKRAIAVKAKEVEIAISKAAENVSKNGGEGIDSMSSLQEIAQTITSTSRLHERIYRKLGMASTSGVQANPSTNSVQEIPPTSGFRGGRIYPGLEGMASTSSVQANPSTNDVQATNSTSGVQAVPSTSRSRRGRIYRNVDYVELSDSD